MNQNFKDVLVFALLAVAIVGLMYGVVYFLDNTDSKTETTLTKQVNVNQNAEQEMQSHPQPLPIGGEESKSKINNEIINKNMNQEKNISQAIIKTNLGEIVFEFSKDKPMTTENFKKLASQQFYDGVKFHRVIKGFMIQTGDPLSKDNSKKDDWGKGGPGYKFADELTGKEKYIIGTVAMANSGPNTNGSQFFIMTNNTPLPANYTVFGQVVSGQDIANKISEVATANSDRPVQDIIIESINLK